METEQTNSKISVVDSHSHIHKQRGVEVGKNELDSVVMYSAVLSIDEDCWKQVTSYCTQWKSALPGLGIHPWFVDQMAAGWQRRLVASLREHQDAIVGEIGLCKCAKNLRGPGAKAKVWPMQVDAFLQQLTIAAELQRPVSVHCVKAHQTLLDCLKAPVPQRLLTELSDLMNVHGHKARLPPAIALHSFSGTIEHVRQLLAIEVLRDRLFFGFSHTVNVVMGASRGSKEYDRLLEVIRAVPDDSLLIESDVNDVESARASMWLAVQLVAEARAWSVEHVAERTSLNGMRFLHAQASFGRRVIPDAMGGETPLLPHIDVEGDNTNTEGKEALKVQLEIHITLVNKLPKLRSQIRFR